MVGPSGPDSQGVVVNHVHNHFESGLVQCAHHVDDLLPYCGAPASCECLVAYEASGAK